MTSVGGSGENLNKKEDALYFTYFDRRSLTAQWYKIWVTCSIHGHNKIAKFYRNRLRGLVFVKARSLTTPFDCDLAFNTMRTAAACDCTVYIKFLHDANISKFIYYIYSINNCGWQNPRQRLRLRQRSRRLHQLSRSRPLHRQRQWLPKVLLPLLRLRHRRSLQLAPWQRQL